MCLGVKGIDKHALVVGLQVFYNDGIAHAAAYGINDGVNAVRAVNVGLPLPEYAQIGAVCYQYLAFCHIFFVFCIDMQ